MATQCPRCNSLEIETLDRARTLGTAVGFAGGAVTGAVGALRGARMGSALGAVAGPVGLTGPLGRAGEACGAS